jgi:lipoyl-dependent peroxiredoxin subunit C
MSHKKQALRLGGAAIAVYIIWPVFSSFQEPSMLTVGDTFPQFSLTAVQGTDPNTAFKSFSNQDMKGKWAVVFFWPKDFTFICPTEIAEFNSLAREFSDRDTLLIGASTDSDFVHLNWQKNHPDLGAMKFPWLSDIKRELSMSLGILDTRAGVALRATFIVDDQGIIRHASVNDLSVGRNPQEVLRVLDGLQSGELCACNWQKGEKGLKVA